MTSSESKATEHQNLKDFLAVVFEFIEHSPQSKNEFFDFGKQLSEIPLNQINLSELRMATNDMIDMLSDMPKSDLAKLERYLALKSAPSFFQMQDKNFRKSLKIISKGHIRNEDEYRVLRSSVEHLDKAAATELEKNLALNLLDDWSAK